MPSSNGSTLAHLFELDVADRRARDLDLLDALDAHPGISFEGAVWRVVREERDPLQGYPAGARWDPGTFDVLYTSLVREGALSEIYFHLSRQPVFPSKLRSVLHRVSVRTKKTLQLVDSAALAALGVNSETYESLSYSRSQEIGDAAAFLGFDGLLVPSARWNCNNLVLFVGRLSPNDLVIEESEQISWDDWRRTLEERRKD